MQRIANAPTDLQRYMAVNNFFNIILTWKGRYLYENLLCNAIFFAYKPLTCFIGSIKRCPNKIMKETIDSDFPLEKKYKNIW